MKKLLVYQFIWIPLIAVMVAVLFSCSPKSVDDIRVKPTTSTEPEKKVVIPEAKPPEEVLPGEVAATFDPKMDILFVIDNSDSMKPHQDDMARNLDQFINRFSKHSLINFHIGVVAVWDSKWNTNNTSPYGRGELQPVKSEKGEYLAGRKERFVHSGDLENTNFIDILRNTLNIGVFPLREGGPENEEVLSAITGAIDRSAPGQSNEGFFRPDAPLAIVLLTDAEDGAPTLSPDSVASRLKDFKGGDLNKIFVMSILANKNDDNNLKDYGLRKERNGGRILGPDRLINFTNSFGAKGQIFSINAPKGSESSTHYGNSLGRMGDILNKGAMNRQEILLKYIPEISTIRVFLGDEEIGADEENGWTYNSNDNKVVINGLEARVKLNAESKDLPDGSGVLNAPKQIFVRYTPIDAVRFEKHRTH